MSDQSHTPLPWVGFNDSGKLVAIMPAMREGDICTFQQSPSRQDADLILRSVNSLPSLVKALEEIESEVNRMVGAVEVLARHQEQCDEDGVLVKVSRQAVDELTAAFEFINHASGTALAAYRGEGK